ncbi:MAG: N-acetyltransferase [Armatimonadetes bacterium]|nr:N-acetyltransferase [Armatimonadota bacterium]
MSANPPILLRTEHFLLRPITTADAQLDYEAVMATKDFLRGWEQTGWPADDFTVEENRADLLRMEKRHKTGESWSYTVLDPSESQCLGCVYITPTSAPVFQKPEIIALDHNNWADYDVAVYFWIRKELMETTIEREFLDRLQKWFAETWKLRNVLFITSEVCSHHIGLLESKGYLSVFNLKYADKPGLEVAFGRI